MFYLLTDKHSNLFQDVFGVILGGTLGHGICTGLAVLGGRFIAQRISVRTGKFLYSWLNKT